MMDIESAIKLLKANRDHYANLFQSEDSKLCGSISDALDMSINALEKQIPKKCDKYGRCKCGCILADWNYCPKCGQKIDRLDW